MTVMVENCAVKKKKTFNKPEKTNEYYYTAVHNGCSNFSRKTKTITSDITFDLEGTHAGQILASGLTESVGRNMAGMFLLHYGWDVGCAFST